MGKWVIFITDTMFDPDTIRSMDFEGKVEVRYSDIHLLEKIVSADDFPKDILIDCDGVDLGLEKFVERNRLLNIDG